MQNRFAAADGDDNAGVPDAGDSRSALPGTGASGTTEERLTRIENALASLQDIESKAAVVAAAEQSWKVLGHFGGNTTFIDGTGRAASLPDHLLALLRSGGRVDATVETSGDLLVFEQGGQVIAEVPRGLAVALPRLLGLEASSV